MSRLLFPRPRRMSSCLEKLERLGWPCGLSVVTHGVTIGLRAGNAEALRPMVDRLPVGWTPASTPIVKHLYSFRRGGGDARLRQFHLIYVGAGLIARTQDEEEALAHFSDDLLLRVAAGSTARLFVSAGVVGFPGGAVLICGKRGSGRSRLVAGLIAAGGTYYSDSYAVLDGRGRVQAFSSVLHPKDDAHRVQAVRISPAAFQSLPDLPVSHVVFTSFAEGARWRPRAVSPGAAVLRLLAAAVPARRRPRQALAALERVCRSARLLSGRRGDVSAAVPALMETLS